MSESSTSWSSASDDDAPTGGFPASSGQESLRDEPAAAPPEAAEPTGEFPERPAERPSARAERSPFEPVERSSGASSSAPADEEDPGPEGTTPRFGTGITDPQPEESSFGSFGSGSFGASSYGSSRDEESSFGSFGSSSFRDSSFDSGGGFGGQEDTTYEPPRSSYGRGTPSPPADGGTRPADERPSFAPPPPKRGVTASDEAEEQDFFASDDHPPMWDKVVAPSGPPPKPGKPSSGNLRLPEWMRDEMASSSGGPSGGSSEALPPSLAAAYEMDDGKSRRGLYIGLGILLAGLIAVGGVYVMKGNGNGEASNAAAPAKASHAPSQAPTQGSDQNPPPEKALPRFKGVHSKAIGRVSDARSGLSYPRLARPWAVAPKKSPMNELGFSASQFAVTEKEGAQPKHWARLMSAQLAGVAAEAYKGPGSEREGATELAKMYEERMFNFRHKNRALASEALTIGTRKGWLVSDYVTYRRPGTKATGDIVAVALIDTGKKAPGVLFMSIPNTSKKLWPDVNFVVRSIRLA